MSFLRRLLRGGHTSADNVGTRFIDENQAQTHWITNYVTAYSPVLIVRFPTLKAAEHALQELSYMHKASDTGEIISTEVIEYGCYTNSDGQSEVILCGSGLTMPLWLEARRKLQSAGGDLWKAQDPR